LNLDNFSCRHIIIVLAGGRFSFSGATRGRNFHRARALGILILFEVTIRGIAIVLRELVTGGLRKILNLRFNECTEEY